MRRGTRLRHLRPPSRRSLTPATSRALCLLPVPCALVEHLQLVHLHAPESPPSSPEFQPSRSTQRAATLLSPSSWSEMEDVEPEGRIGRRKQKINAWQGVVIGVATVAGLGLVSKLLSFSRRDENPKKIKDADIASLEAVLSGDAAKSVLPPQTAKMHESANLENEKSIHESVNGHAVFVVPSSNDADSVSEVAKKDEITGEVDGVHASQDLVGDREVAGTNPLATVESLPSPVHQEQANGTDVPHSNWKGDSDDSVAELHIDDTAGGGKPHIEDAVELHVENVAS